MIRKRLAWVEMYEITRNPELTCKYYGSSRATLFKWVKRYKDFGLEGLKAGRPERGRLPINGRQAKERTAFTLDAEVAERLAQEPNKSALVNRLLRQHYGLDE